MGNFALEMKKNIVLLLFGILHFMCMNIYSYPKYEVRGVWLTTIGGLDWPHSYARNGFGIETQKNELCDILDKYVEAGFNTVLFQTRVRGTVCYPSAIEPWETAFSGEPCVSPGYDVLEFVINECHKRGLKVHAWVVAIPLGKWDGPGCVALRRTFPSLLKKIKDEGFMNPENKGVAEYLSRLCKEIVSHYDVDGIHLDYIRYPDTWGRVANKDIARNNITRIVRNVHESVKSVKPWVAVSCSPVGKYADTKRAWSRGWNARDVVCQDVALWLREGLMDMIFPMMYFKNNDFYPFAVDWQERSNGRIVVPGLGIYFMHPSEGKWTLNDISREMMVCRQLGMGTCFFRSNFFTENTKGLYDYTKTTYSPYMSMQPPMSWLSNVTPPAPENFRMETNGVAKHQLKWDRPLSVEGKELKYNIYGSVTPNVNTDDAENLLASDYSKNVLDLPELKNVKYFAVTSVDRYGNESVPVNVIVNEKKHEENGVRLLENNGKLLTLKGCDIMRNQVVEIHSLEGNALTSRFVTSYDGHDLVVDISSLQRGHYKIYFINKKGDRHLLGRFYKQRKY